MISPRNSAQTAPNNQNIGTGKATLRLRSKGPATVEAIVRHYIIINILAFCISVHA